MTQRDEAEIEQLTKEWTNNQRWAGVSRDYGPAEVVSLRGSLREQHTMARVTAEKLWEVLTGSDYVNALGAISGGQAVQMVKAGLRAIYLSGWQVAGDANLAEQVYPDQSLYPANSAPALVRRINNALRRADQIHWTENDDSIDWFVPIVADGEAGFGGALNVYELTKA
ncbi:MAG TPA: isocitrate lyase, partial [Acidimicrobiia bacterium]|nr:isocitrate lyase [Acidimicrobiia bacterium]